MNSIQKKSSPPLLLQSVPFDLIRSTRLTPDSWETVCTGVRSDFHSPDPDVTAATVSILAAIPSYRLGNPSRSVTKRYLTVSIIPVTILGFQMWFRI